MPIDAKTLKETSSKAIGTTAKGLDQAMGAAAPAVANGTTQLSNALAQNHGLRIALVGSAFIVLGLNLGGASAWTIPALAVGTILILAGVLGTRLSGRLSLEWGEQGASFEMRARIAPPPRTEPQATAEGSAARGQTKLQVIDSTGETIEMDLIELRRLLPDSEGAAGPSKP
jgi:hypothetical protein